MKERDVEIARQLKERLSEVVPLIDFRVFGSRARGDSDEDSDMDVFIEVESLDRETREKIFDVVWEVGFDNYLVISPITCTPTEIKETPFRSSSVLKNIYEEGQRI
jgi:predicted nucleotidyltransferase